jgi:hypothetical protein
MKSDKKTSSLWKLATRVGDRHSRRNFFISLSTGAAAFFGVKFLRPVVAETFLRPMLQTTECNHDQDRVGSCNKSTGARCGMVANVDCAAYNDPVNCVFCYDPETKCPRGSTVGLNWEACCRCIGNETQGHRFKFWDCCGKASDLNHGCTKKKCKDAVAGTGCIPPAANAAIPKCSTTRPPGTPNTFSVWCGNVKKGAGPLCTFAEQTTETCGSGT